MSNLDQLDQARWDDDGGAQPNPIAKLSRTRRSLHRKLTDKLDELEATGRYERPAGWRNYPRHPVTVQHRTADPWHDLPFDFEYAE